ncbi:MAG: dihydroorotase [Bacteroidales bacterium]|nr:dihydroorotase [Bacteroidales bacterium]MBN2821491.1 dihydroorotase [Bacteroidales bacterium]
MGTLFIKNATIINEEKQVKADVLVEDDSIKRVFISNEDIQADITIDAHGFYLLPGVIDDQVHFREPGLTHKGEIETESAAAAAGGVTSFMEMPNTFPQAVTLSELEKKYDIAEEKSWVNYSFYLGGTNDNLNEIKKLNPKNICGVKVFMGSSTGNMLVDKKESLEGIFSESPTIITTHCEDEETIQKNTFYYKEEFGDAIAFSYHPLIRSEEACYKSSSLAVELATKYNSQLHVLHLSTAKELELFDSESDLSKKKITGEVCVHHLWFNSDDYLKYGGRIKWNPAVKTAEDQTALLNGLIKNKLDVIATDHAPHTLKEKENTYFKTPSGGPLVQHSLIVMLEMYHMGKIDLETLVRKMCHAPADLFRIKDRGYIREGYKADLVLVDLNSPWKVSAENILYKCKWSPFEGTKFNSKVMYTIVNGKIVYEKGKLIQKSAERLIFNR